MPNFSTIGTALAGRFAAAAMTPPAGYRAIRVSTTALPSQMPPLPAVLLFPEEGSFDHVSRNSSRGGTSKWKVRFYYDQAGDLSRAQTGLLAWLTVLADQLLGAVQLGGTALVQRATIDAWRIGTLNYAGVEYLGIEFDVSVTTFEGWTPVA